MSHILLFTAREFCTAAQSGAAVTVIMESRLPCLSASYAVHTARVAITSLDASSTSSMTCLRLLRVFLMVLFAVRSAYCGDAVGIARCDIGNVLRRTDDMDASSPIVLTCGRRRFCRRVCSLSVATAYRRGSSGSPLLSMVTSIVAAYRRRLRQLPSTSSAVVILLLGLCLGCDFNAGLLREACCHH